MLSYNAIRSCQAEGAPTGPGPTHSRRTGQTPDDMLHAYPYLVPAAVYDAISYYVDHREESEAQIAEN